MSKIITLAIVGSLTSLVLAETPAQLAQTLYQKGQTAEKAGDPVTAKDNYTQALKADPNNANARYSIGQLKLTSATLAAQGRETKFGAVMIPVFQLDGANLQEALVAFSLIIEKQSKDTITPNFVIEDPKGLLVSQKISLNLKNMPSKAVMKYLMDSANAKARYDEHAVVVSPK